MDDQLREAAILIKHLMALPVNKDSSALVEVDLWEVADFILAASAEATRQAQAKCAAELSSLDQQIMILKAKNKEAYRAGRYDLALTLSLKSFTPDIIEVINAELKKGES